MPASRIIVRIEISPSAAQRIPAMCERFGCTQLTLISRLVEWYDRLPDKLQSSLLGLMANSPNTEQELLKHLLGKKK